MARPMNRPFRAGDMGGAVTQAFGLVVRHKSWLMFEPGSLLVGAMDDSS